MNKKEFLSHARHMARQIGLTLVVDKSLTINNQSAFKLIERGNKSNVIMSNMTFASAYTALNTGDLNDWKMGIVK